MVLLVAVQPGSGTVPARNWHRATLLNGTEGADTRLETSIHATARQGWGVRVHAEWVVSVAHSGGVLGTWTGKFMGNSGGFQGSSLNLADVLEFG